MHSLFVSVPYWKDENDTWCMWCAAMSLAVFGKGSSLAMFPMFSRGFVREHLLVLVHVEASRAVMRHMN